MTMEFNEKLQELRKQKNMTQDELAEHLYVSRTAISKWESGRGYPSIESLKAIDKKYFLSHTHAIKTRFSPTHTKNPECESVQDFYFPPLTFYLFTLY